LHQRDEAGCEVKTQLNDRLRKRHPSTHSFLLSALARTIAGAAAAAPTRLTPAEIP